MRLALRKLWHLKKHERLTARRTLALVEAVM
jgi:hypothetical protein